MVLAQGAQDTSRHSQPSEALSVLGGADVPLLATLCRAKASAMLVMLGEHFGADSQITETPSPSRNDPHSPGKSPLNPGTTRSWDVALSWPK